MTSDQFHIFAAAFLLSASGGIASLLKSPDAISPRRFLSSFFNSGLMGLAVGLVWYYQYRENLFCLIGLCLVVGLGGAGMVEFLLGVFRRSGINLNFKGAPSDPKNS